MAEKESRLEKIAGGVTGVIAGVGMTTACLYNPELTPKIIVGGTTIISSFFGTIGGVGAICGRRLVGKIYTKSSEDGPGGYTSGSFLGGFMGVFMGGMLGGLVGSSLSDYFGIGNINDQNTFLKTATIGSFFGGFGGNIAGSGMLNSPIMFSGRVFAYGLLSSALILGRNYINSYSLL
ncbi:MAG TPA: hypothetical protein VJK03_05250 [Candidatus Nanoarchaeia archaeon]|nr:hypothetical protein [Candidatus Nanoarchaeia archaeon]